MSDTHECIDKKELYELRRRAAFYEEQKPKQWEPPHGTIRMYGDGCTSSMGFPKCYATFGMSFTSLEQVEEAKPLIRSHNRLIQYVMEHGGIQSFIKGTENWTVDLASMLRATSWNIEVVGSIYMTKECAESLVAGLKDGTVIL